MLKLAGLVNGHYECRSLDETLPVMQGLLAMDVLERRDDVAVVKHPNTDWRIVIHQGGPDAPNKPHGNHYGFRVADHTEVKAAWNYLTKHKREYGIKGITKPAGGHFAYSTYFNEPGGNTLEIEYYNERAAGHGRKIAAGHWDKPLSEERFPGRGYIPQALSHGTLQTHEKEASNRFYTEVLGLNIVGGGNFSTYIGHPDTPWYVVVLPSKRPYPLRSVNRFTLQVASAAEVEEAHADFTANAADYGLKEIGDVRIGGDGASFIIADLDRNWWEIANEPSLSRS
jgi:catechol-2,3-dioxygenase